MKRELTIFGLSLAGFMMGYGIIIASMRVSEMAHTYWAGVATAGAMLFGYYRIIHPRLRPFPGYEYAALLVAVTGGIPFIALVWMAATGAAP